MTAAPDLLAIGEPLYELSLQEDGRYLPGFGGDTSNVAIAAARMGARTAYCTLLGADPFAEAFRALWRREGVDASRCGVRADAPTGVYFITLGQAGHEFTYLRRGSAASLLTPADLPGDLIAAARCLHVSAISQAISTSATDTVLAAMEQARAAGRLVSYDTNLRLRLWPLARARAIVHAAAASADLLKTSLEDAEKLTGLAEPAAIAAFYRGLGARQVVVTLGGEGALVASAEGQWHLPGHRVEARDATGAGDAFTGALLAEFLAGAALEKAARFANAAAALSTLGRGAVAPLPRRPEVEAFLAAGG